MRVIYAKILEDYGNKIRSGGLRVIEVPRERLLNN